MRYEHIVRAVLGAPWAIDPDSLAWAAILDVLSLRASGGSLTDHEIAAQLEAAGNRNGSRSGGARDGAVAVIPVYGVISPRATLLSRTSGGTTAEQIAGDFAAAFRDPEISGIVLDIDSPGGQVEGVHELAEMIRANRGEKPIVAVANHMAASAAYWIAAAADEVVVTPSGQVGSIGIISAHEDVSERDAKAGVRTTLITAGKFKGEGSPYAPLTEEAVAERQAKVDAFYRMFTSDVSRGRGVGVDVVRGSAYGEGRSLLAKPALDAGMVDHVDTLGNTIRRVARGDVQSRRAVAAPVAATLPTATVHEAIGGTDTRDDGDVDDASAAPPVAAIPERTVPPRRLQRVLHEAAVRVGHPLTAR